MSRRRSFVSADSGSGLTACAGRATNAAANTPKSERRFIMRSSLASLIVASQICLVACGSSPTAPSSPPPVVTPPAPTTVTITGHVTATNGGQPLGGVQAALGTTTSTTDGSGSFSTSMLPQASITLALTGSGIVPRSIRVAAMNTRDVQTDAIQMGSGFDLGFYRQFVRNGFEDPAQLQPLRRWTVNPNVYLRTVDDAGAAIDARTLDTTEQAIRDSVPTWTAGAFGVATLQRGTETMKGSAGWLTVEWMHTTANAICGTSDIGLSGGTIELFYRAGGGCRCAGGPEITPRTVRHEVGHAMGFYHTTGTEHVMSPAVPGCDAQPSARERYHAAIAYSRPVGNSDPDQDPIGVVNLRSIRVP